MLICKHCESKHWMDHKLVIPINSEGPVQYKTSSVEASRRASPPCLRVRKTSSRPGIRVGRFQVSREKMSIANNIDYGVLSRINVPLEQPSDLVVVLMSTVRLCHMVTFPNCPREPLSLLINLGDYRRGTQPRPNFEDASTLRLQETSSRPVASEKIPEPMASLSALRITRYFFLIAGGPADTS